MYIYGKFYAILIYKSRKIYEQYNSLFHDNGHQNSGSNQTKKKKKRKKEENELPANFLSNTLRKQTSCSVWFIILKFIISFPVWGCL